MTWKFHLNCYYFYFSGSVHQILDAHFHYVQGVAWDPLAKYVASLSSDRTCRIYINKPQAQAKGTEKINYVCQHVITKAEQPSGDNFKVSRPYRSVYSLHLWVVSHAVEPSIWLDMQSTKSHLFHDETLPSFFRRLAWSPDGSFLVVPAGIDTSMNCKFMYIEYWCR